MMIMSPFKLAVSKGLSISENVKVVPAPWGSHAGRTVPVGCCVSSRRPGDVMP